MNAPQVVNRNDGTCYLECSSDGEFIIDEVLQKAREIKQACIKHDPSVTYVVLIDYNNGTIYIDDVDNYRKLTAKNPELRTVDNA